MAEEVRMLKKALDDELSYLIFSISVLRSRSLASQQKRLDQLRKELFQTAAQQCLFQHQVHHLIKVCTANHRSIIAATK